MKIEKLLLQWFQMSDDVWERHANPMSVWTRYPCLPILALAIWSRAWIGAAAWLPIVLTVVWIWLNPRVFAKPVSIDNWASKSVLGERLWLQREEMPIAIQHGAVIGVSNVIAAVGAVLCVYGLVVFDANSVVVGLILTLVGKSWFLDRMVWIYQDANTRSEK